MKKLLFFLLLFPAISHAQKVQLSVMGGGSLSNITGDDLHLFKNYFSPNGRLKLTVNTKVVSFGASADIFNVSTKTSGGHIVLDTSGSPKENIIYSPLFSAITVSAFIEKRFSIGKSFIFGGINAGYIINNKVRYDTQKLNTKERGFSIGLQFGITTPIYKKLSFMSEVSPRYISLSNNRNLNAFVIPLNAGVSYSF